MTDDRARPRHVTRWRRVVAVILAGLAILGTPAAVLLTWTERVALDTSAYTAAVAPLAHDRAVREAMTAELTDAVLSRPGAPANSAVRAIVAAPISRFVASDAFAAVWTGLNRRAHAQFIATAGDRSTALRISGDTLQLDLTPVLDAVRERLATVGVHLPATTTRTTIAVSRSPVLAQIHRSYVAVNVAAWVVWPVVLLLGAGSIALARPPRRRPWAAGLAVAAAGALIVSAVALRLVLRGHSGGSAPAVIQHKIVDAVLHPLWIYFAIATAVCLAAAALAPLARPTWSRRRPEPARRCGSSAAGGRR